MLLYNICHPSWTSSRGQVIKVLLMNRPRSIGKVDDNRLEHNQAALEVMILSGTVTGSSPRRDHLINCATLGCSSSRGQLT